jgi:low temperature requirement protein LtrA
VQALWIGRLLLDERPALMATFWALVALELLVPVLAERHGVTPFHPHHIAERYGLLTIIVLGEVILASVQAVQGALGQGRQPGLLLVIMGGLLTVFSMWWLFFKRDHAVLFEGSPRVTFAVGYGHYVIFASVAATGAALAASVDVVQGDAHTTARVVGLAFAAAVAVYVWSVAVLHAAVDGESRARFIGGAVGAGALLIAAVSSSVGATVLLVGVLLAVAVAQHVWSEHSVLGAG